MKKRFTYNDLEDSSNYYYPIFEAIFYANCKYYKTSEQSTPLNTDNPRCTIQNYLNCGFDDLCNIFDTLNIYKLLMKKIYLISASFLLPLYSFAQRGRAMPDDLGYSDNDYSTSSSDGSPTLYIVLLIILFVGVIWFNVALKSSNNKDIKEKRTYVANGSIIAYAKIFPNSGCKPQGPVNISPNTKCYIMEYLEENYCKVKFENHPQPLYVKRNEIILPPKKR